MTVSEGLDYLALTLDDPNLVTVIRTLGDTYFLALAMKPDGNLGKGRYLMRLAAPKLIAELS